MTEQQMPESFEAAIEKLEKIVTRLESGMCRWRKRSICSRRA